jgi:hypothetical protein
MKPARDDRRLRRIFDGYFQPGFGGHRFLNPKPSFRDGPKDQTRNLEIPGSMLRIAPE